MDVGARVVIPMVPVEDPNRQTEPRPLIARGIAIKKSEYIAMGATPGCYGCGAIARGDTGHKPHTAECRRRAIEWLKRQDNANIQEQLQYLYVSVQTMCDIP